MDAERKLEIEFGTAMAKRYGNVLQQDEYYYREDGLTRSDIELINRTDVTNVTNVVTNVMRRQSAQ